MFLFFLSPLLNGELEIMIDLKMLIMENLGTAQPPQLTTGLGYMVTFYYFVVC